MQARRQAGVANGIQKIGEALRKLGWRRVRIYGQWGGRRYWLPKSYPGS